MALTVEQSFPIGRDFTVELWTYDNIDSDDTAPTPVLTGGFAPAIGSMQVIGDFGTNASVALQGSNDGTNWAALSDTLGTVIAVTAAGIVEFSTACIYIRPLVTSGTAEDLDILIALRG